MNQAIEKKTEIIFPISNEQLAELKKEFKTVPDCETKEGYEVARKGISKLVTMRTTIDKARKKMTAESRQYQANVNATAAQITAELAPFEECWKAAKLLVDNRIAEEKAEEARVELERIKKIKLAISEIQNLVFLEHNCSSQDCADALSILASIKITAENFQEFLAEAVQAQELTEYKLKDMYSTTVKREEQAVIEQERIVAEKLKAAALAEQNRVEAENLAKERAEYEAKIEKEAKERKEEEKAERLKRQNAIAEENKKALEERQELNAIARQERLEQGEEQAKIAKENQRIADENQRVADKLAEDKAQLQKEADGKEADELEKEANDNQQNPGYEMCVQSVAVENQEPVSVKPMSEYLTARDSIAIILSDYFENDDSLIEIASILMNEIAVGNIRNINFTGAK